MEELDFAMMRTNPLSNPHRVTNDFQGIFYSFALLLRHLDRQMAAALSSRTHRILQ
jgi:hypothetical protein